MEAFRQGPAAVRALFDARQEQAKAQTDLHPFARELVVLTVALNHALDDAPLPELKAWAGLTQEIMKEFPSYARSPAARAVEAKVFMAAGDTEAFAGFLASQGRRTVEHLVAEHDAMYQGHTHPLLQFIE